MSVRAGAPALAGASGMVLDGPFTGRLGWLRAFAGKRKGTRLRYGPRTAGASPDFETLGARGRRLHERLDVAEDLREVVRLRAEDVRSHLERQRLIALLRAR